MLVGVDIGSVAVKVVLMNGDGEVIEEHYRRSHGQPLSVVYDILNGILSHIDGPIDGMAATGGGGKLLAELLAIPFVNEVLAQAKATGAFHPEARSIIEIGGEDSKLILVERDASGNPRIRDFAMNTLCAAGTGAFLDQQAVRLGVDIEGEFGELALKSEKPPRIAGRCSVFAKTDMIHLQQEATPVHDIVAGLCYALVRNYRSNIAKGKEIEKPVAFQGGVAANVGIVHAFEDVLDLKSGELIIPKYFRSMGAIGAVLLAREKRTLKPVHTLRALEEYLATPHHDAESMTQLSDDGYEIHTETVDLSSRNVPVNSYVGVDIGSISTNVVVIDEEGKVLARRYLMTAGRPIEAVKKGLYEVGQEVGDKVRVLGAGTTGSGRYLIGDFIGADIVKNEITTHAKAAAFVDPEVDTIFEIGGQDAKYVSMANGAVVDFAMNKVCAAGTGSFLEEQADRLGIKIEEEFGQLALQSTSPSRLGERCTVFMESELNRHLQLGAPKEDLVAGLSYSVVLNYLNRVVEGRKIGDRIFFQGGVAANRGVKAAFEKIIGKKVIVPPQHDIMGAIGAALCARDAKAPNSKGTSKFKGFDLRDVSYKIETFTCEGCSNNCEIRKVTVGGDRELYYGSRCGRYDHHDQESKPSKSIPKLFAERRKMLLQPYGKEKPDRPKGKTVVIPQVGTFFDLYPFWRAFFTELGFDVRPTENTSRTTINSGSALTVVDACFPVKVAHGHMQAALDSDADYVFLPSVINMDKGKNNFVNCYICPLMQSLPFMMRSVFDYKRGDKPKVLTPVIHFEWGRDKVRKVLLNFAKELGCGTSEAERAVESGYKALDEFRTALTRRGREILDQLGEDEIAIAIVGRPYNTCDDGLNLGLPDKLRDLGVLAIPMDFLPLDLSLVAKRAPHMYWRYGQRILAAAYAVAADPRIYALYVTNFGCGPDSFVLKYFDKALRGKASLVIEVDEHSADVGAITRCEAFLDSIHGRKAAQPPPSLAFDGTPAAVVKKIGRRIYIPHMDDHGRIIAAAMRAYGVDAEALPMSDEESLLIGQSLTSGKECYPCIITTGDIVRKTREPDFDPDRSAFIMAIAHGPCRFGQYHRFHRMVLDELGFENVPIIALDQTERFHEDLGGLGPGFQRLAWQGALFVDCLQKLLRQTRPYETDKGASDRLYQEILERLGTLVERKEDLRPLAREARERFARVPVDRSQRRPRVGVIGEIYVRSNEFANGFLARRIEKYGGEALFPPFEEWVKYISYERRVDFLRAKNIPGLVREMLSQAVQTWDAWRILLNLDGSIRHFPREKSSTETVHEGERYLPRYIRGEAILSMGRAREYVEAGVHGIVNVAPFNCMPGHVVNALLEQFRADHDDIPVLKLSFDGTEQSNDETRLEAFMHQAAQWMERRSGS